MGYTLVLRPCTDAVPWNSPWPVRDRRVHRCGRHGGGLSRARYPAGPRRRAQDPARRGCLPTRSGWRGSEREAQLLASLNHPNIAADLRARAKRDGRTLPLSLELVEGESLARYGSRAAVCRSTRRSAIARQIAEALEAAHERGIVHRDLKPANVKVHARRHGQGSRFRTRQGADSQRRCLHRSSAARRRTWPRMRDHRRHDPRHRRVHGPGTGAWPGGLRRR